MLITIFFGQCNDAKITKITLGTSYVVDCDARNLINFLTILRTVCYEINDGGLPYMSYKMVVAVKTLHNSSNSNPNDPHAFKEELKIKFSAVSAITGRFPSRPGILEHLLQAETPSLDWGDYYGLQALHNLYEKRKRTL